MSDGGFEKPPYPTLITGQEIDKELKPLWYDPGFTCAAGVIREKQDRELIAQSMADDDERNTRRVVDFKREDCTTLSFNGEFFAARFPKSHFQQKTQESCDRALDAFWSQKMRRASLWNRIYWNVIWPAKWRIRHAAVALFCGRCDYDA